MHRVCIRIDGYVAQDHYWMFVQYLNKLAQQMDGVIYGV